MSGRDRPARSVRRILPRPTALALAALAALLLAAVGFSITNGPAQGAASPLAGQGLFARLVQPFAAEAQARRQARTQTDADYRSRVDPALAVGRVNFLLFGYGETFEPPFSRATIGSLTVVSFDTRTGRADLISLTHDVRAPEVERVLTARGARVHAVKIDQAYDVGGFDLMRQTVEDATGLPIDFQVSFRDVVVKDLVDDVFGKVTVDVPAPLDTAPFFLDGAEYASAHFAQGMQALDGSQAMQYMKSLQAGPTQSDQRNARKDLVLRALLSALTGNCSDRGMWLKVSGWAIKEQMQGNIAYDFDPGQLVIGNISSLGSGLPDLFRFKTCTLGAPQITRTLYIVDPESGGAGVRWASSDATVNSITRQDIDSGLYEAGGLGVAVPLDGNPYGDLVDDYWGSVRRLVRATLSSGPQ